MPGAETKVIQGKRLDFRCTLKIETAGFVDGFSLGFSRKRGIENESEVWRPEQVGSIKMPFTE